MKRPANIGEHLEQLRPPVRRSEGSTPSERYLASIAEKTFLNLWSYPNPYRDQKQHGEGTGKELCDLLVVSDPHIIIFSEKDITWPNKALDVAWSRWFRKAVHGSSVQLKGAERWIREFPSRVFLDEDCREPFPLSFPPAERRRFHRVVIARGASEACRRQFEGGFGTFVIKPELRSEAHWTPGATGYEPFSIGDIDPTADFVHVFDEVALDLVMHHFDTITDFTSYLDKRANFIRSGRLIAAEGEEELIAYYSTRLNSEGDHDFGAPDGHSWDSAAAISLGGGGYHHFINHSQFVAMRNANRVSYAWDSLIEVFTGHMLGGTSIVLPGHTYSLTNSEIAVRHMASLSRFERRGASEAIIDALRIGEGTDIFFRLVIGKEASKRNETAFFILTLKYLDWMDERGGYEQYRQFRSFHVETYAQAVLVKMPHLRQVIGIAMEPPNQGRGTSEDIIYAEQHKWTPRDIEIIQEHCDKLGIMGKLRETPYHGSEYPDVP